MALKADFLTPASHSAASKFVITGFNTDVEFNGVTYHVQTEDKGLETPFILTLVYDRGTILASKRQPYEDLFEGGFDETQLASRLQRQHSLICAAIKAGRIDELIAMTRRDSRTAANETAGEAGIENTRSIVESEEENETPPIPKPKIDVSEFSDTFPLVEVISVIEDEILVPTEAVEIVSDMAGRDRTAHNRLCLEFINETPFKGGEQKTVTFMVCRGTERKVIGNAQIMVKILGSNIRPQIFHSVTDKNGLAKMELEVPEFSKGRAAFVVRASAAGEEIEVRRAIYQSR